MPDRPRILIVDDDEGTRRTLALVLGRKGYRAETAATAREALEKAGRTFYNAALLDIRLPDGEGIDLIGPIRAAHPETAVVMVTAFASLGTSIHALNAGAAAYVIKPIEIDEVLATLAGLVEKQRLAAENARLMADVQRELAERRRAEARLKTYYRKLRSLAAEVSLAEARERRRLAQSLHDSVAQALAMARLKLAALSDREAGGLSGPLREVRDLLDEAIMRTRGLSFDLSPPILHERGLVAALRWLADALDREHHIPIRFSGDGAPEPESEAARVILFLGARELILNAVKHARPASIQVHVDHRDGAFRVTVTDDGRGFDAEEVFSRMDRGSGYGLFSLRERLNHLGGYLKVESAPGRGTRALMAAPLVPPTEEPPEGTP